MGRPSRFIPSSGSTDMAADANPVGAPAGGRRERIRLYRVPTRAREKLGELAGVERELKTLLGRRVWRVDLVLDAMRAYRTQLQAEQARKLQREQKGKPARPPTNTPDIRGPSQAPLSPD